MRELKNNRAEKDYGKPSAVIGPMKNWLVV